MSLRKETPRRELRNAKTKETEEGEFSFEIDQAQVYTDIVEGWTKEANVVEWNGGNAKLDIRGMGPRRHTHGPRNYVPKQDCSARSSDLHCFGRSFNHQRAREQWVPREDEEICACFAEPDGMRRVPG